LYVLAVGELCSILCYVLRWPFDIEMILDFLPFYVCADNVMADADGAVSNDSADDLV